MMRRFSPKFSAASLTTYLIGWFCIAPILVLCTCADGHAAYSFQGHADPACGQHDESDGHRHSSDSGDHQDHQDHDDEQLRLGEMLTSNSIQTTFSFVPVCIGIVDRFQDESNTSHSLDYGIRAHGPPESVLASITCTILLI